MDPLGNSFFFCVAHYFRLLMPQMCFCCTVGKGEYFFRSRLGICFEVEKFAFSDRMKLLFCGG